MDRGKIDMDEWRMDVWMVCYYNTMARQHYHVVVDIFSCCREFMEWGKTSLEK